MFFFVVYHKRSVFSQQRVFNYLARNIKKKEKNLYKLFSLRLVLINGVVSTHKCCVLNNSIVSVFALCFCNFTNSSNVCVVRVDKYKALVLANTLYVDANFIFLNKAAGITTQRDRFSGFCLLEVLTQLYGNVYSVHRLDKSTTGCMVFIRTSSYLSFINKSFYNGCVNKKYYVVAQGVLYGELCLCVTQNITNIIQKTSILNLRVIHNFNRTTLIEVTLITGRKHQIRVGLFFLRRSIIGDFKYSEVHFKKKIYKGRLFLHCRELMVPRLSNHSSVTVQAYLDYFFCNFIFLLFFKKK